MRDFCLVRDYGLANDIKVIYLFYIYVVLDVVQSE